MTSLMQDIRGALQTRAATASGFPGTSYRKYEGRTFAPVVGTTWVQMTLKFAGSRVAAIGAGLYEHRGVFMVDVNTPMTTPDGTGTADLDTLVDAIAAVFAPGVSLTQGAETVTVIRTERSGVLENADWSMVSLTVNWLCYSTRN